MMLSKAGISEIPGCHFQVNHVKLWEGNVPCFAQKSLIPTPGPFNIPFPGKAFSRGGVWLTLSEGHLKSVLLGWVDDPRSYGRLPHTSSSG